MRGNMNLDAALEARERRAQVARSSIAEALRHLHKARNLAEQSEVGLRRQRLGACDADFVRASEKVADAMEALSSPTVPGASYEAGKLSPRDGGSHSVTIVGDIGAFAWRSDRMGYSKDRELQKVSHNLNALGLESRRLSSGSILSKLADSGWGPDELGEYVAQLMDTVKEDGTIRQKVEVLKLLKDMIQHTEPRALFELKDVDLADLTEDELAELTRSAAQHVARESARLQAGLPPSTTTGEP